ITLNNTYGLWCYAADGNPIFSASLSSPNDGDITIGRYVGGKGIFWDDSAGILTIKLSPQTRKLAINCSSFTPANSEDTWIISGGLVMNGASDLNENQYDAPVNIPNGCIVTSIKAYYYRDDAASAGILYLVRNSAGSGDVMASVDFTSTAGGANGEDTSISYATIDNETYSYSLNLRLDPNDNSADVKLFACSITYTITDPLP
ncbi:MAG: hypothetical protein PHU43_11520, partial [Candidatus Bipolaricaulis sp.]|nr:hypothetical protein [Candidatus Bipolaricaulis sp.]